MGLAERVAEKQAANLPPSAPLHLEDLDEHVIVRCLMAGPMLRINAMGEELSGLALFAFAVEDPDKPGVPAFEWGNIEHRARLDRLSIKDLLAVVNKHNELSGVTETEAALLGKSVQVGNGSISSPPATASPPES